MTGAGPVFVLLTDFGLADPYAGQLRAALFTRAPSVPILDLSHGVPPFAVHTGAFFLAASRPHFPAGSIFICVVDPGVGSSRDLLCVTGQGHTLLGPDNGLLSLAHRDLKRLGRTDVRALALPPSLPAATFHGRDVLAPAAAALALGADPARVGPRLDRDLFRPPWAEATLTPDKAACAVLHVDRFGNCILNLPFSAALPRTGPLFLETDGKRHILTRADHYAELPANGAGLLRGSQGFYELARNGASAAALFDLASGDVCRLLFEET